MVNHQHRERRSRSRNSSESRTDRRSASPGSRHRHSRDHHADKRSRKETSADYHRDYQRPRYQPPTRNYHKSTEDIAATWEKPSTVVREATSILSPPPPPSSSIALGGIDACRVSPSHIRSLFHQCGLEVTNVDVCASFPHDVHVQFHDPVVALAAVKIMHGGWIDGRLVVASSIPAGAQ